MTPIAPVLRLPVGVVVERRKAMSPWVDYLWRPVAVLPGIPEVAPWTVLAADSESTRFYAGAAEVLLHRAETARYRDNLAGGSPSLWIVLAPTERDPPYEVLTATADPSEGEAMTEAGGNIVEAVPMPEALRDLVDAFVAEHHVERAFYKRERDPYRPSMRRPRMRDREGGDER